MKIETLLSADGSSTLFLPEMNETYHSRHGAITESQHVYIDQGLARCSVEVVNVLEFGFGTGLNALLSLRYAQKHGIRLNYASVEIYPLPPSIIHQINYGSQLGMEASWQTLHQIPWGEKQDWEKIHTLFKYEGDFRAVPILPATIDLIYYDAFGPSKQAEVWQNDYLEKAFDSLKSEGLLVTYCAQGQFKRNLKELGFQVEALKGPPGKLEMVLAKKI
ncbi:MAG TPA: methyltransferase [Bacteroidetes bacterium]|nr:methyltransferase [Bacteroidota bacterium]